MERMICLDGVAIALDVDKVEIDLQCPGLFPANHLDIDDDQCCHGCHGGEKWHPIMSFHDGTTVYLHCPPEGEDGHLGYRVQGPRPHRWNIAFMEDATAERLEKVARLSINLA